MENIAGKNVLAFGSGGGMGAAINKVLLENKVGNLVVSDYCEINDVMQKTLDENKNVFYEKGDVSSKEFVQATFKKYFNKLGYIDIVLNLAAILDENRVERTAEINLLGTIYTTYEALEYMGKHRGGKGGTVVNLGSICGFGPTLPFLSAYTSTKHAVVGFCRCLMDDLFYNMTGVKVVVLCPGVTITPLVLNADQRMTCFDEIRDESKKIFEAHPVQEADQVAKTLVLALKDNHHGIYKVEDSIITKVTMPKI